MDDGAKSDGEELLAKGLQSKMVLCNGETCFTKAGGEDPHQSFYARP
jgi:hypothetical protein